MSFLQLVLSLDKTIEGNNSILENMSIWPISQHLPFFEEWMFVVIVQLVLGGVSVETNRTVEYAF